MDQSQGRIQRLTTKWRGSFEAMDRSEADKAEARSRTSHDKCEKVKNPVKARNVYKQVSEKNNLKSENRQGESTTSTSRGVNVP